MNKVGNVRNLIYTVRGQQVMLDADLAHIYGVEVKRLNEAVKRNADKFPPRFMFQLTKEELDILRSQIATSNGRGGRRYLPYVFTEYGVIMLSSVLNSPLAVKLNIAVIDAFVEMRRYIAKPLDKKIEDLEKILMLHIDDTNINLEKHTDKINAIIASLNLLLETPPKPKRKIGFGAN